MFSKTDQKVGNKLAKRLIQTSGWLLIRTAGLDSPVALNEILKFQAPSKCQTVRRRTLNAILKF